WIGAPAASSNSSFKPAHPPLARDIHYPADPSPTTDDGTRSDKRPRARQVSINHPAKEPPETTTPQKQGPSRGPPTYSTTELAPSSELGEPRCCYPPIPLTPDPEPPRSLSLLLDSIFTSCLIAMDAKSSKLSRNLQSHRTKITSHQLAKRRF
ncbi:hypothetical protein GQ607_006599, partial [Colletotrichum asianum]